VELEPVGSPKSPFGIRRSDIPEAAVFIPFRRTDRPRPGVVGFRQFRRAGFRQPGWLVSASSEELGSVNRVSRFQSVPKDRSSAAESCIGCWTETQFPYEPNDPKAATEAAALPYYDIGPKPS
jgi:hypothetical protein